MKNTYSAAVDCCLRKASLTRQLPHVLAEPANHHVPQFFAHLNVPTMAQPKACIGYANKLFNATRKLADDGARKFLANFIQARPAWVIADTLS